MANFWNGNSELQALADALQKLVPVEGEVADPKANPKLERFRKAVNVYYDVFNNGCCNRGSEFAPTFKLKLRDYRVVRGRFRSLDFDRLLVDLEKPMQAYVVAAAAEQVARLGSAR